jgi:phage regulator Rha-like protein
MEGKESKALPGRIQQLIFLIRDHRVMLSTHLAELYEVEPRALIQAVKRNIERFPGDFMFRLTETEFDNLKSQIVISSWGGLRRATPYAFTEQGVAMLSSVLRGKRAVQVNVEIMRAFVRLRDMVSAHKELARKLAELEQRIEKHDEDIRLIFEALRQLMVPPEPPRKKIGFEVSEKPPTYRTAGKRK